MLASMSVVRLIGVYNADGGIIGEVRYVIGHLLGTAECALCDITHSPMRRKPEWDAMVKSLDVPFSVLHRNELGHELSQRMEGIALPCVVAERTNGDIIPLLAPDVLAECGGSVQAFAEALRNRLQAS